MQRKIMQAVIDSNIIIDALKGIPKALSEIESIDTPSISIITWIEVMTGAKTKHQEELFESFLKFFSVIELDQKIAKNAYKARQTLKLKTPDAIIYATAVTNKCILVTGNSKDFKKSDVNIRVPY